jgi:hypothetical protein
MKQETKKKTKPKISEAKLNKHMQQQYAWELNRLKELLKGTDHQEIILNEIRKVPSSFIISRLLSAASSKGLT